MDKILVSRRNLKVLATSWRREGVRIVFTNGVFDVIHRGHVELLEKARSWGDVLVVGLNSDASVRRLKGASRPINNQRDRARVLKALKPVDFICIFGEDTPLELIKAVRPHILVKGSEYGTGQIVGAGEVKSRGGQVKRFRMKPGYSSSVLIQRLRGEPQEKSSKRR